MKLLIFLLAIIIIGCSSVNEDNLKVAKEIIQNPQNIKSLCVKYRIKCVDSSQFSYCLDFIQNHRPFILYKKQAFDVKNQKIDSIENFRVGNYIPKNYTVDIYTVNEISFIDTLSNIVILKFDNISGEWEMYNIILDLKNKSSQNDIFD